jgi:hypothetical protein
MLLTRGEFDGEISVESPLLGFGETVDNVKVQMFRARQKLKTMLEAKI